MTLAAHSGTVTHRRSGQERVSLLLIRCSVEEGAPETLRIRTTFYPELSAGIGDVRVFAAVDAAATAVAEALNAFAARAGVPGTDGPRGPA